MSERTRKSLILVVAVFAIFFQTGAQAGPCIDPEKSANKCFTSYPSGLILRVIESGPCADVQSVNGFPHQYPDGNTKLWCYQVENPTTGKLSRPKFSIQIPLSFYGPATSYTSFIPSMNTGFSPIPIAYPYNDSIGCTGDSTGFGKGDRMDCGMTWSFNVDVAGGAVQRFYYKTLASLVGFPGVAPKVMFNKINNNYESGIILGADSNTSSFTPQAGFVCQHLGGKNIKMYKDENNCVVDVEQCADPFCAGECNKDGIFTSQKVRVELIGDDGLVKKSGKVVESGVAGGSNACGEGQTILKRSDGTPVILLKTQSAFFYW